MAKGNTLHACLEQQHATLISGNNAPFVEENTKKCSSVSIVNSCFQRPCLRTEDRKIHRLFLINQTECSFLPLPFKIRPNSKWLRILIASTSYHNSVNFRLEKIYLEKKCIYDISKFVQFVMKQIHDHNLFKEHIKSSLFLVR